MARRLKMFMLRKCLLPSSLAADLEFAHPKLSHLHTPTQWLSHEDCNLHLEDVVQQLELVAPSATPPRSETGLAF